MTGLLASQRSVNGEFETHSINASIELRLLDLVDVRAGVPVCGLNGSNPMAEPGLRRRLGLFQ